MMGVSFDPASEDQQRTTGTTPPPTGVQEAIRVLSLRLPRVVGANAVAPSALIGSPGGSGRVDSIVQQVLSRYFPTGAGAAPAGPGGPPPAPVLSAPRPTMPSPGGPRVPQKLPSMPTLDRPADRGYNNVPRVIVEKPGGNVTRTGAPDFVVPPATIAPAPQWPNYGPPVEPRREPGI